MNNRNAGQRRMTGPEKRKLVEGMRRRLADLLSSDPSSAGPGGFRPALAAQAVQADLESTIRGMVVGAAIHMDRMMRFASSEVSEAADRAGRTIPPKDIMAALIVLFLHAAPEGVSLESAHEYCRDMREVHALESKGGNE